jgi:hypothetical protein
MIRRLVSRSNDADDIGAAPSVVVVLRITVDHAGQAGLAVELDDSSDRDDAMWRPDVPHPSAMAEPDVALEQSLPHPHYADVELTETPVTRRDRAHKLNGSGFGRLPQPVLIAAAAAVGLVALVTMRSTVRPTFTAETTPTLAPPPSADDDEAMTPSAAQTRWILLDGENGHPTDTDTPNRLSGIPTRSCRQLLVAAPLTLRADATTWILKVIVRGARNGQTLDQVIHDQLVRARTARYGINHSDPEALHAFDSVIADAADEPCSSIPCTAGDTQPKPAREDAGALHGGWRWLCGA